MRRLLVTLVALLGLLAVASIAAAPTQVAARPFEATAVPYRIETHLPPRGRAGDRDLLRWVIRDRHGRSFGIGTLRCDWFRGGYRLCGGTFQLARGTFVVQGSSRGRSFGEFIVVAGTGDYAAPRGPLRFNATAAGKLTLRGSF